MTISLQGQTVVVTGGSKRLGRAIALECARAGASVCISFRSNDDVQQVLDELYGIAAEIKSDAKFAALELDVLSTAQIKEFTREVFGLFDNVTGLVNNAAIFERTLLAELSEADFDAHIDVNLKAPYLLCLEFGKRFLAGGGGSIVNMADIYGIRPLANYIPYCISKAGVIMLTQSMAKALAPIVRVNCIAPGTILATPDGTQDEEDLIRRIPFGRLGTPEEIAQSAVFLLGGPSFITGTILPVDGAQILR